jgi:transcriptional regulator with XRE-family HTH domain
VPIDPQSIESIAKRLRALRAVLGLTQAEMVASIGSYSGPNMWGNFEAGYRRISTDHALALKHKYGLTLDWIYTGNPAMCDPGLIERIRSHELSEARESREDKSS